MTQVPATATTNAPKYQIDKCEATRTQHKTRSPSILHPAKKAAKNATPSPLLPFNQDNSVIMISSLLLLRGSSCPAITTATNATFSLQLIVESFSTGAKHIFEDAFNCANKSSKFAVVSQAMVPSMTIGDNSNGNVKPQKLIVIYSKRSLRFRKDCGIFCEGEWEQQRHLDGQTGLVDFIGVVSLVGLVGFICIVDFIGVVGSTWLTSSASSA